MAGHAAVGFNRQPSGIAFTEEAQKEIKSLRMLTNKLKVFDLKHSNDILSEWEENEAYCLANRDKNELLIYFPANGTDKVNTQKGKYVLFRVTTSTAQWHEMEIIDQPGVLENYSTQSNAIALRMKK